MIDEGRTTVAFETPHRIHAALEDIAAVAPDVEIAVCRELTKLHEEVFRGSPSEARAHFTNPRGEFTLVIGPRPNPPPVSPTPSCGRPSSVLTQRVCREGKQSIEWPRSTAWGGTECIGCG